MVSTTPVITKYFVWSPSEKLWYRGNDRWTPNFSKAKTYNRMGDASNAITNFRDNPYNSFYRKKVLFEIHTYMINQMDLIDVRTK